MGWSGQRKQKLLLAVCATIISLAQGLINYWGNLAVYVDSYFLSMQDVDPSGEGAWMISIFLMFRTIAMLLFDHIHKAIGVQWTVLSGLVLGTSGVFLSYVSVQKSVPVFVITQGVMFGLGSGIVNSWLLMLIVERADEDVGLMSSAIYASGNGGAMLINEFATLFINPLDDKTTVTFGRTRYFTQKRILDRVPSFFLILGGLFCVTQVLGCFLWLGVSWILNHYDTTVEGVNPIIAESTPDYGIHGHVENDITDNKSKQRSQSVCLEDSNPSFVCNGDESHVAQPETKQDPDSKGYTPMDLLRSPLFYVIWLACICSELPNLFFNNYYKLFGQAFIHDDHFLTTVGTTRAFFNIWGRMFWGHVMDRIGVKKFLIIIISALTLTSSWYYFTPMVSRWLYFVMTVLSGSLGTAYFTSFLGVVTLLFGKKNVVTNLGMVRSCTIILNVVAPYFFSSLLAATGWFYTCVAVGALNVGTLFLIIKFLPAS